MLRPKSNNFINRNNAGITTIIAIVVMLLSFFSCGNRKKELGEAIAERDSLPRMATVGVTTFVSDSGITQYKVEAEEWLVFDRKNPSYWSFEKGLYLEKFDSLFNVDASIKADTAYYYDKEKLWKLIGNVEIKNLKGERFNTELLYWDEKKEKVYSDRHIRIEQIERITEGKGFESNQQMTNYKILKMTGEYYFDQENPPPPAATDSIAADNNL